MKRYSWMAACAAVLTGAAAEPWQDPGVNAENRIEAHAWAVPLADEKAAFTAEELSSPFAVSLNGNWKYHWCGEPAQRPLGFEQPGFDDAKWATIDVPSCVEMRGWGVPVYPNQKNPFPTDPPKVEQRYNPVSSYRTTFAVPAAWNGRDVFLRFDGVYSAYYVWVNGKKVGYAEDSKLPSTFDITPYLDPAGRANLLCVEVYRWSDGSYLEDQDMFRFSGIYRDVTLYAAPKDGVKDIVTDVKLKNDYNDADLTVQVASGAAATCALYDAAYRPVAEFAAGKPVEVRNVNLWSAEKPYLYTLVVKAGADVRSVKIGFKEVRIDGAVVKVNGKHVKLKGVNRHETSPENGRALTRADMLRDVRLMKRYNINCVRTSHYPDHRYWYELCDRYGIYIVAEANVEAHAEGYGEQGLGRIPMWEKSIVERNANHVKCYRNHACVTMWSLGNETGHGDNFRKAYRAVKDLDPMKRPVHWERGCPDADVDSTMYPTVEWLFKRGLVGEGKAEPDKDRHRTGVNDHTAKKAFFLCEYAHAMGNAIGNFQEYWDAFYSSDTLWGGCIWDWIDQGIWKYTDRIGPDGKRVRYIAYGGDFDETPNDGPFCCNGVIDPERNVTPKLIEVGHVHRNLVTTLVDAKEGVAELWNRYGFTGSDEFAATWELLRDGKSVDGGRLDVPSVAPLSRGTFRLPRCDLSQPGEYFLNVSFALKTDTLWAERGYVVARDQLFLGKTAAPAAAEAKGKVDVEETEKEIVVKAAGTEARFCRRSGTLWKLVMDGKTVLEDAAGVVHGPRLTCFRAFTDNDIWLRAYKFDHYAWDRTSFYGSGLTQLAYHPEPVELMCVWDDQVVVRTTVAVDGAMSAGFRHETVWTFRPDGKVSLLETADPHGKMPQALPRLGTTWKLDGSLENVSWYGRGPAENYVDRCTGSFVGRYASTVTDLYTPYVRPQDCGYRGEVRTVSFTDGDGKGVTFTFPEPMFVQALHYAAEDLEFARHRNGQQRIWNPPAKRAETIVNIDRRQLGLGGASCGPGPMAKYRFPIRKETWALEIAPAK